jgi:exonuclease V gamma subunit
VHAFDSRYFEGGALPRSSSARHLEIAKAIAEPPREPSRIELLADVETDTAGETLTTNELSKWLWNPAREFIRRVLRAKFETSTLYEPTHALIELTPLAAARVGGVALDAALRHEALAEYLRAAPEFPDGTAGKLKRLELAREIDVVDRTRATVSDEPTSDSRWLSVQVGDARLEGRLGGLHDEQRVVTRFTKPRRRTELQSWIEHLVLLAAGGRTARTELVMRGDETNAARVCFGEPADPAQALEELVALYRASRERPLPLFERASWAYAEAYAAGGSEKAVKAASGELRSQRKWDPRLDYVVGPSDPFADPTWCEAFGDAALRVYGRLLEHRSER